MTTEKANPDLAAHVEAAERAVTAVKDPRLREIAFGRILEHLLSPSTSSAAGKISAATATDSDGKARSKNPSTGVSAWLRELVEEGFFGELKSMKQILQELSNRSHHLRGTDLTRQLQTFCHDKMLRRRKQAPAEGGKEVFHWSNW